MRDERGPDIELSEIGKPKVESAVDALTLKDGVAYTTYYGVCDEIRIINQRIENHEYGDSNEIDLRAKLGKLTQRQTDISSKIETLLAEEGVDFDEERRKCNENIGEQVDKELVLGLIQTAKVKAAESEVTVTKHGDIEIRDENYFGEPTEKVDNAIAGDPGALDGALSKIYQGQITPELFAHAYNKMISYAAGKPDADATKFVNAYKVVKNLYARLPNKELAIAQTEELRAQNINAEMVQDFITTVTDSSDESEGNINKALKERIQDHQTPLSQIKAEYDVKMKEAIEYCVQQGLMDMKKGPDGGVSLTEIVDPPLTQEQRETIAHKFGDIKSKYDTLTPAAKKSLSPQQIGAIEKMGNFSMSDVVSVANGAPDLSKFAQERVTHKRNADYEKFMEEYQARMEGIAAYSVDQGLMTGGMLWGVKKAATPNDKQKEDLKVQFDGLKRSYDGLSEGAKQLLPDKIKGVMSSAVDKENVLDRVTTGVNASSELTKAAKQRQTENSDITKRETAKKQFSGAKKELASQILKVAGIEHGKIEEIFTEPQYEKQRSALLKRVNSVIRNTEIGYTDSNGQLKIDETKLKRNSGKLKEEMISNGNELAVQASMHSKWTKRDDVRGHDQKDRAFKKNVMQFDKKSKADKTTSIIGALEREDDLDKSKYMTGAKDLGKSALSAPLRLLQGTRSGMLDILAKPADALAKNWKEGSWKKKGVMALIVIGVVFSGIVTGGLGGVGLAMLGALCVSAGAKAYKARKDNKIEQHFAQRVAKDVDISRIQEEVQQEKAVKKEKVVEKDRDVEKTVESDKGTQRVAERDEPSRVSKPTRSGSDEVERGSGTRQETRRESERDAANKTPKGNELTSGDREILSAGQDKAGDRVMAATKEARQAKADLDQQKKDGTLTEREHATATKLVDGISAKKVKKAVDGTEKLQAALKDNRDIIQGLKGAKQVRSLDAEDLLTATRKKEFQKELSASDDFRKKHKPSGRGAL